MIWENKEGKNIPSPKKERVYFLFKAYIIKLGVVNIAACSKEQICRRNLHHKK